MIELFYVICGITGLFLLLFFLDMINILPKREEDIDYSTGIVFISDSTGELVLVCRLNETTNIQGRYNNTEKYTNLGSL